MLVRLSYRGKFSDFVVPIKSNINSKIPRKDYLSLPPNSKTKEGFCHGLYYIKLFPIKRKYLLKYHYDLDKSLVLCKSIIDKNEKIIVSACQRYLDEYASGIRNRFTPDIDAIIEVLHNVP
ncbi:MAG: hypothetical protein HUJ86_07180 [Synergistes sp.]|nr:hypothetical protein [Synergistes sp.]